MSKWAGNLGSWGMTDVLGIGRVCGVIESRRKSWPTGYSGLCGASEMVKRRKIGDSGRRWAPRPATLSEMAKHTKMRRVGGVSLRACHGVPLYLCTFILLTCYGHLGGLAWSLHHPPPPSSLQDSVPTYPAAMLIFLPTIHGGPARVLNFT